MNTYVNESFHFSVKLSCLRYSSVLSLGLIFDFYYFMYYKLKLNVKTNIYVKTKKKKQIYKINFRYTQVLFMGSVPRINYPLANVFLEIYSKE